MTSRCDVSPSAVARYAIAAGIGAVAHRNIRSRRSSVHTPNATEKGELMQFRAHPSKESVSDALTNQIKFRNFSHRGPFVVPDGAPPVPCRRTTSHVARTTASTRGLRARAFRNQCRNLTHAGAETASRCPSSNAHNVEYVGHGQRESRVCFERGSDT